MHVRAVTGQIQPGKMQEAIDIYKDSLVPATKAQKGFQGAYLMTDASSGKALSISVWESEADMEAGQSNAQEQIGKFRAVFSEPPTTEHYDLSVEAGP